MLWRIEEVPDGSVCRVCSTSLAADVVVCPACESPSHPECWRYNHGCATFGCVCAPSVWEALLPPSQPEQGASLSDKGVSVEQALPAPCRWHLPGPSPASAIMECVPLVLARSVLGVLASGSVVVTAAGVLVGAGLAYAVQPSAASADAEYWRLVLAWNLPLLGLWMMVAWVESHINFPS